MLRGKFKKEFSLKKDKLYQTDIAVVGDKVKFDLNDDGTGFIYEIFSRENYLSRKAPRIRGASYRGERLEQIIAANIDQVFIVTSISEPNFNNKTVDRFLVACESSHLSVKIIINKTDLDEDNSVKHWQSLYSDIGYEVFLTSTKTDSGIEELKSKLPGRKNLFWGQSGVGKSSLLNKIYPHLNLKVGEISNYTSKGTHTTVTSTMFFVGDNTYIIDTPGIREIDPYGIRKEDLGHYFIEFKNFINDCKFSTCTHNHEPGCAVVAALEKGLISEERYDSYLRMLETVEEDINF
ncbi:Putative GTPase [Ignavibacterium album JCM 16511]|uniref:Small ribosomal subunit biogenesis GTPase RsgA n=1 Tax=Ignavibacterium album (strain DSM 19864 / JCM 16511 / NBRC 101810 / Mat9-16) TaxID=945713 RepID=I0AJ76_IGNAJ|nr:Putative GTPase [Ignavibacterium album JCM 16511]